MEKQIEVSSWWQSDEIFKIIIFCLSKKFLRQFFENPVRTNSQAKGGNYFLIRQRSKRGFFLKKLSLKNLFLKRPQPGPKNDQVVKNICEARHIPLKRGVQLIGGFQESLVQNFW